MIRTSALITQTSPTGVVAKLSPIREAAISQPGKAVTNKY
jgi:hypothetical protein